MGRLLAVILGVVCAVWSALGPHVATAAEPVKIAVGQDFKPFEFVDENGDPAGLVVDFWRLWSEKTKIPIEFKPAPWGETLQMMQRGEADIHAGLNQTDERKAFLDYGDPLLSTNSYVFSPIGMQLTGSVEQLAGFRIGVLDGSLEHSVLQKQVPGAELVPFKGIDELYDQVAQNKIRLFADVEQTGLYFLKQRNLVPNFRFDASKPLDSNYLFVAAAKGKQGLLKKVNDGMRAITPLERAEITRRWLRPSEIKNAETLVIAISRNNPPYTFVNTNGEAAGMLVDIWHLWAEKTGQKIEFHQSSSADTLSNLGSGDADIHSGLTRSADRSSWIEFTRPIYETSSSLFHRSGENLPTELTGKAILTGKVIGVVGGANHEAFVRKNHPEAKVVTHGERKDLIRELVNGTLDAFLNEDRAGEDLIRRLGMGGKIVKHAKPELKDELLFGIRKGEVELKAQIERGLDAISLDEFAEIERRWIVKSENRYFTQNPLALTADERAWLAANPVLRVHNEMDWPPFNFNENGKPQGYSIDYMNLLAAKVGVQVEYVSGPSWGEFLELMKAGNLDVMLNIVKTPDRLKYMDYTRAYADIPNTILSHKDQPYDSLEQLFGKTISVPKGFFYEEILKRDFPQIKLLLVKDTLESMKAVTFGKADAAFGELAVFNYLLEHHFMNDLVLSGEVKLGSPEYALLNIAARKQTPLLASILDKGVQAIDRAEVTELRRKWLGDARAEVKAVPVIKFTQAEQAWLAQHKEINIGVDPDYPPFEFVNQDGTYVGISSEYVKLIGERLNIKFKHVPNLSWSEVLAGVKDKTVDMLPAVTKSPERESFLNFSKPHLNHPSVIITRDDFPFMTGLSDLKGQTVAMVKGYSITEKLKSAYPSFKAQEYDTPLKALKAVATGKAVATVGNMPVFTYVIRQNSLSNLKVAAIAETGLPGLSIGVRKDWPELVSILDKVLQSLTPEEHTEINERWVSMRFDVAADTSALVRVGLQVGGGAVVIIMLIVGMISVRNRRLENDMRAREEAAQAKSDFVAVVSHEVRTPMNGVLGMARLILETPMSAKQKDFARTIVDSGEALLDILNDLLDISKLEAGKLELETIPFMPEAILKNSVNIMAPKAKEKDLALTYDIGANVPHALLGDANRLRQILLNLLSNAMKFTAKGEIHIKLDAERDASDTCWLLMSVSDTGSGISDDVAAKIFAPYMQATTDTARKYGGTGLGLAICRRIAKLMGGTIELDSTLGVGSTFSFKAPFEITELAEETVFAPMTGEFALSSVAAGPGLRVLIVEDNLINIKVAKSMTGNLGHHCTLAENGQEALDIINAGKTFDVILMDRHMPVMDGIEATQKIRLMDGPMAAVPIIAVTAAVTQSEIETCLEVGMNDVVSKPVDPDELSEVLSRIVSGGKGRAATPKAEGEAPILDQDVMDRMLHDFGDEVLAELIDDFKKLGQDSVAGFKAASDADDIEAMTRFAHDLKSNAATLGLKRLSTRARDVELACKEDRLDDARKYSEFFPECLGAALLALESDSLEDDGDEEALTLFLAKMAHDIRNNMNVVLGYARMFQDYAPDTDKPDDLEDYALNIQRQSAKLQGLSEDIITLLQIESGRFELTPEAFDPNQVMNECVELARGYAANLGVMVSIDEASAQPTFNADPKAFKAMISHLLGHAINVTRQGGAVRLTLGADGDGVSMAVIDQGPGITEEEIAMVRGPFGRIWQADGPDGVHYNIVDRLASLQGGQLQLNGTAGQGTSAILTLPSAS